MLTSPAPPPAASSKQPLAKLKIIALDPKEETRVIAHFNPKEVQIDKAVKWNDHATTDGNFGLEFSGGASARTITIELLFDRAEEAKSVRPELDALYKLTQNVGTDVAEKRPPIVLVMWANSDDSLPNFPAVIESLSVKCQMFSPDGKVLRATATVKLKEAGTIFQGKKDKVGKTYSSS